MKKLFAFFIMLLSIGSTQAQGSLKNYENDKYRFSFSYPGEYLLEKINDEEWVIHKADNSWVIMFKIMHLQGKSYDGYVNSLSTSIINAYFKELSAKFGSPEKGAFRQCLIGGFEFDEFSSQYLAGGTAMEKLTNSMIVYLDVFRKTSHKSFIPDGIIIYSLGPTINFDNSKLTRQLINTFEKTVVFKEAIVTKPVVTTVTQKKPVTTTPVANKPVATKAPTSIGSSKAPPKLTSVKIGKQTWMVKNLDVATYRNGDPIPNVTDNTAWSKLTTGAYCYYKNDSATYAATYGKIYNWYAVNDARGLAPAGWRVPSDDEWTTLINYLGGEKVAGRKMKEKGATHWAGLPGGWRSYDGTFHDLKIFSYWWSSKEINTSFAWHLGLYFNGGFPTLDDALLIYGSYVRCLRN